MTIPRANLVFIFHFFPVAVFPKRGCERIKKNTNKKKEEQKKSLTKKARTKGPGDKVATTFMTT
jgi:hypothetical protein